MSLTPNVPLLIVGAGRSGTNLLSHVIEQDPKFWNSFENRYIWNYGQQTLMHDVRKPEEATPRIKRFIRGFFEKLAKSKDRIIIDKTPSNIFRVEFARAVFPEIKVIHIIRDGRDNVLSRQHEWFGGRDVTAARNAGGGRNYRLAFLRKRLEHLSVLLQRGNLPVVRWPIFLLDNAVPFFSSLVRGKPRRYGERFPGMKQCLETFGILETASIQWHIGVMHALSAGRRLPPHAYLGLKYEDLLSAPEQEWRRLSAFLGIETEGPALDWLKKNAKRDNFGKWRTALAKEDLLALEPHIRPTLEFLGYPWE